MRMVILFCFLIFGQLYSDESRITCDHGTRDYDREDLLEAAYGDMSIVGIVTSFGCQDTVNSAQISVQGQTNLSANNKLVFTTLPGETRLIQFTSGNGLIIVSAFTQIKNLHLSNPSGGVVSYIAASAGGNILYDAVLAYMVHSSNYGFGQESGTNNEFRNCVVKQTIASSNPGLYGYNSGTNVKINNCTFKMVGSSVAVAALNSGVTFTVVNTALKANICLNSALSPTYITSKVYTSDATGTNTNITDGQFNFGTDGYSLVAGSILINNGVDAPSVTSSINGVPRKSGKYDVGAFEFPSSRIICGPRRKSGIGAF